MSSLYIINSPKTSSQLQSILATITANDAILLIQDACYMLKAPVLVELLQTHHTSCYALQNDIDARNSAPNGQSDNITTINYNEFVELTLTHQNSISW